MSHSQPKRILVIDDNSAIHEDFHKILDGHDPTQPMDDIENELFGSQTATKLSAEKYNIDSVYQGQKAIECVKNSVDTGQPYALAFVDIRMPPGWDGIETIRRIWEIDKNIQVVICTAYSDYTFEEISQRLTAIDNFMILKKPFDVIEVRQITASLIKKWELTRESGLQLSRLQKTVVKRTTELEKAVSLTKATLESTPDALLVVSHAGDIQTYNHAFLSLWNISEELVKNHQLEEIYLQLSNQMEEPELFINMLQKSSRISTRPNIKEWQFKSGKVVEVHTHPQCLNDQIIGTAFSFQDITDRKKLEAELLFQATHDSLTGLPNRILLRDRIQQAIIHAKRYELFVGVLILDLDNFKQMNDSLGHDSGDLLLKAVAKKLQAYVRESDTITRYGGDEFVIVLTAQAREKDFIEKAEQLLELFSKPCKLDQYDFHVKASIGISIYPKDGITPEQLLKNADVALYRAKDMGRNTFQFYMAEFNDRMAKRTQLTLSINQALEKNEFILHYQPLWELNSDKIIGVEALVRWQHPVLGLLLPEDFISLSEETGHIIEVGEWVLRQACLRVKSWQETIGVDLAVAVNISVHQLLQKNFVDIVHNILVESQLDPHCLELEVTESVIMKNVTEVAQKMNELKDLGIRFSIDDFGTGYASLSYLKYFPFDKIKIDKIFIEGISSENEDNIDSSIIEAIINMTKKMHLTVLAEGVETQEQIEFLRQQHSDQVQGYYFSKPLDDQACTKLLQQQSTNTLLIPIAPSDEE